MITRKMIDNGFENKLISIENEYNGCTSICCKIGNSAFYFTDMKDADLSVEEYWKIYTLDETIDRLYNILKDVKSAEDYGLDYEELIYYNSILSQNPTKYKGYKLHKRKDGKFQTFKARPYDDAKYYWGISDDKLHWNIIYKGKKIYEWNGPFEQIVDKLESYNVNITPKIIHM